MSFSRYVRDTRLKGAIDVFVALIHGENDDACLWIHMADHANRINPAHVRQLQIHQRDIRTLSAKQFDGFAASRCPPHGFDVWLVLDQSRYGLEHDSVIIHTKHANGRTLVGRVVLLPDIGTTASIWVPFPRSVEIVSRPRPVRHVLSYL